MRTQKRKAKKKKTRKEKRKIMRQKHGHKNTSGLEVVLNVGRDGNYSLTLLTTYEKKLNIKVKVKFRKALVMFRARQR